MLNNFESEVELILILLSEVVLGSILAPSLKILEVFYAGIY
jgi:hypothetical protein